MKHILRIFVLSGLLCGLCFSARTAPSTIELNPAVENLITRGLYFQKTEKGNRKFPVPAEMTRYEGQEVLNLGFNKDDYWFFFRIKTSEPESDWILEFPYPFHDKMEVWIIGQDPDTLFQEFSDRVPFGERAVDHRYFQIPLRLKPGREVQVFARLRCEGEASSFPVKVMQEALFRQQDTQRQFAFGLYYGILLFAWILSVFLVIRIGENVQYDYLCYLSGLGLFQFSLDGFAFQYLWPGLPWLANHIIPISGSLTLMFLIQFTRAFLKVDTHSKRLSKFMQAGRLLLLILAVFAFFGNPLYSVSLLGSNLLALPVMAMLLTAAIRGIRNQIPQSRYFLTAFTLLIMGSALALLKNLGLLPRIFITEYGIQIGSAVEIMMLSFGLAENLRNLKSENEKVQARLLVELQEKYRMQQLAKAELEDKVEERTRELKEKNVEIALKNKDITDSIQYALRIQQATLPHHDELQELLPESFVWYQPRDIVSGDFYWAGKRDGWIFIAVADCTGHGVPGSMMSMAASSFFNEIINVHGTTSPAEILEALRLKIIQLLRQEKNQSRDGMDISLMAIDRENRVIRFAGAYNPVYLLRNGDVTPHEKAQLLKCTAGKTLWALPADRFPVGMLRDTGHDAFSEKKIEIIAGDTFLMFTDGYADQFGGEKGKKLKSPALQEIFFQTPYEEMKEKLAFVFKEWKGDHEQVDDVCIFGFRIR